MFILPYGEGTSPGTFLLRHQYIRHTRHFCAACIVNSKAEAMAEKQSVEVVVVAGTTASI